MKYKDDILEHFRFKRWRNSSNRARYNSGRRNVKYFILILVIGCSIGSLCAIGIGFFLAGRDLYLFKVHGRNSNNSFLMHHMNSGHHLQLFNQNGCFIPVTIRYDRRKSDGYFYNFKRM